MMPGSRYEEAEEQLHRLATEVLPKLT